MSQRKNGRSLCRKLMMIKKSAIRQSYSHSSQSSTCFCTAVKQECCLPSQWSWSRHLAGQPEIILRPRSLQDLAVRPKRHMQEHSACFFEHFLDLVADMEKFREHCRKHLVYPKCVRIW